METLTQRTKLLICMLALVGLFLFTLSGNAGDLNPSAPPAPTMKTLDEVEARTPIKASDLPLTISSSGSYYLAETINFGTQNTSGITIDTNDVTIDLNGYSLIGPGKTAGSNGSGIQASSSFSNISVVNGYALEWKEHGIYLSSRQNRVESITASDNGQSGIWIGSRSIAKNCVCYLNGHHGIDGSSSSIVMGCVAHENTDDGIYVGNGSVVTGCTSYGNDYGIDCSRSCSVTNCSVSYNTTVGIDAGSRSVVNNCTVVDNGDVGIEVASGSTISNCSSANNAADGIYASDSLIIGNTSYNNSPNMSLTSCTSLHNHTGP